jgi:2-polyprenyl-3-methyl-5-hydroxy-6-metoxy-1,4-benzoquinol methylase
MTGATVQTAPTAAAKTDGGIAPLRFDELAKSYNFLHPAGRVNLFVGTVLGEVQRRQRPVRALDIGCGHGIALDTAATMRIRESVDELWGIEPDPGVKQPAAITHFQNATMETAKIPPGSIDIAYSCLVMEHVVDPVPFMRAVHACLKPGGVYIGMTINARHYFARITRAIRAVRADEAILRLVRGRQNVEEYHYPVAYKINSERTIGRICREVGFEQPEFAYAEPGGPAPYFPGPLRPIFLTLNWKRSVMHNPKCLLELYCRVRKPG